LTHSSSEKAHEFRPAQVDHEERPWQTFHGESAAYVDMEVCVEMGSLKSSNILVGFSMISHPFWDILGYLHFRKQPYGHLMPFVWTFLFFLGKRLFEPGKWWLTDLGYTIFRQTTTNSRAQMG